MSKKIKTFEEAKFDKWLDETLNTPIEAPKVKVYDNEKDIERYKKRKSMMLTYAMFAIVFAVCSSALNSINIWNKLPGTPVYISLILGLLSTLLFAMSFVCLFSCYRLYGRVKTPYRAGVYSYFLVFMSTTLLEFEIVRVKIELYILFVLMIGLLYAGEKALLWLWNKIGDE